MLLLDRLDLDTLAPEAGDHAWSVDRQWPARRLVEPEQHTDSLPFDVAPTKASDGAWPSVEDTDGTRTFITAMASWRQASLLFTRSVRAFNAAHRRHCHLRSQSASLELPARSHDVARVAAPPAVQPTLTTPDAMPRPLPLTRRQREVAVLIARGLTNAQIAEELVVTPGTAANHVEHILRRLGCRSRAQVAAWAVQNHLLPYTGS